MRFAALVVVVFIALVTPAHAAELSVTIDDPTTDDAPTLRASELDARIRATLARRSLQAALFVCGMRVDSPRGRELLRAWSDDGHIVANHTYSHRYFNSRKMSLADLTADTLAAEALIAPLAGFRKLFRFPFLKEGETAAKRDGMRAFLKERGYAHGAVTIDASDWYVSGRLAARLRADPKADVTPYRDFYLRHMLDRARYYDDLARRVLGRSVRHTLLVHHNLLNALFLDDLLRHLESNGFRPIAASDAFQDPVFAAEPRILPAGESLIWALAKETGRFDGELRYPGEDGEYEKAAMDALGL